MKLSEIKPLYEAELEQKDVESLWEENSSDASEYTSVSQYVVRAIKNTSPVRYEAFSISGGKRKAFGTYNAEELDEVLAPIRPDQTPDAEGFTVYIDPTKTEAFQYKGAPILVTVGDEEIEVDKGDYVTRVVSGKSFDYSIEKKSDFESTLKKVK